MRGLSELKNSPEFQIHKLRRRLGSRTRRRIFGLSREEVIRAFFGGQALVAVVVLALITFFLFREGIGFFTQQREELTRYRRSGMEFVDLLREQDRRHVELGREIGLGAWDTEIADRFADAILPLREFLGELGEWALEIKESEGETRLGEVAEITAKYPEIHDIFGALATELREIEGVADSAFGHSPERRTQLENYVSGFGATLAKLREWDAEKPVSTWEGLRSFFFGPQWITASFWQDFYGVVPLFTGSLLVSAIALGLAVPLGLGAAVYVSQIAGARERSVIKPAIEFIAAIPSVVLGFFGIAVLGQALRTFSQVEWVAWLPGFPYAERLNALTAGCLLALIAVPTIFTLAEDALASVPRALKEGSYALGASRMQTVARVIVPSALSGMISAVLLGLGRVIGETMVVLLCAGNRIAIPDFSAGLGVVVQPVHTMTGIIAQEMGEVAAGTIHYRALFVVGLLLFTIALLLNYTVQKILARYRLPSLGPWSGDSWSALCLAYSARRLIWCSAADS